MSAQTKGLHEELHELQSEIFGEAESITDLDDGKFYYNSEDRVVIRGHAQRILALVDQYENLDTRASGERVLPNGGSNG